MHHACLRMTYQDNVLPVKMMLDTTNRLVVKESQLSVPVDETNWEVLIQNTLVLDKEGRRPPLKRPYSDEPSSHLQPKSKKVETTEEHDPLYLENHLFTHTSEADDWDLHYCKYNCSCNCNVKLCVYKKDH